MSILIFNESTSGSGAAALHPFLRWLRAAGVFLGFCSGTVVLMRQLMFDHELVVRVPFALLALVGSGVLSWFVVRRWRFVSPLRCAAELGVCGGIAGLGLYVLLLYVIAYLFTPRFAGLLAAFGGAASKVVEHL